MRIDAHQHFWKLDRGDYGWLTPDLRALYRDYGPEDLAPLLAAAGVDATLVVQAAPTFEETRFLLGLAEATPWVLGVVGWIDFEADDAHGQLAQVAAHPKGVGVRPMIQDLPDPDWMLRPALAPVFEAVAALGLCFDALVHPRHLPPLLRLLGRHPELRAVVDHGAKPAIRDGAWQPWADDLARIARETEACCKLSGLASEAKPGWTARDLRPYVDHLLESFGPERLLWGSDWPVVVPAGGYARWQEASKELLAGLDPAARDAVLGGNARRTYVLGKERS